YTCPKDALLKITTNVLNAFGAGPAGLAHPSTGTNVKDLPVGVPETDSSTSSSAPRRRTTVTRYYYPPRTVPATSPPATEPTPRYTYTPPSYTYTPPTTRTRSLVGR